MFEYNGLKFHWLGHDSFRIKNSDTIYIDPFQISTGIKANIILITHEHFDHLSVEDIEKISTQKTIIIAPNIAIKNLKGLTSDNIMVIKPGEKKKVLNSTIEAIPAYNINKFRSREAVFHPKDEGRLGYIITLNKIRIYHAGDTDFIPEIKNLKVDVAILPVSGTYVMTAKEASQVTNQIKPKVAIPMHYGSIVGDIHDALKFQKLSKSKVEILKKEYN